jgi:hypothetical protein
MVYLVALSDTWDKTALKGRMNEVMNKNLIRYLERSFVACLAKLYMRLPERTQMDQEIHQSG